MKFPDFNKIILESLINALKNDKEIDLSPINYKKPKGIKAQIAINFDKDKARKRRNKKGAQKGRAAKPPRPSGSPRYPSPVISSIASDDE